jgi:hypothetical protein
MITMGAILGLLGISAGWAQQQPNISIAGTYTFVSRQLSDGTTQKPPDVIGLYTYTKTYRNFSLVEKNEQGHMRSVSIISTYSLTDTQYSETLLAMVNSEQGSGQEVIYDVSGKTGTSPVTVEDGQIQFKLPVDPLPVSVSVKGNTLTATGPDFVDTWEKVQ